MLKINEFIQTQSRKYLFGVKGILKTHLKQRKREIISGYDTYEICINIHIIKQSSKSKMPDETY